MEAYGNSVVDPTTTLDGGINNSTTSVTVHSGTEIPASGDSRILVWDGTNDNTKELMKVTGGGGTTSLTVVRGQEGTSAISHSDGDKVELVLTAEALTNILAQTVAPYVLTLYQTAR